MRFLAILLLLCASPAVAGSLARADAAFARQQPREAWVELLNATREMPANGTAWMYRARVALRLGRSADAVAALDRAIRAGYAIDRTRHFRAHALILAGDPGAALTVARPERIPAPFRAYAARMRGRALAMLGDNAGAAREFGAALAMRPDDSALWIDLARFRESTGELAGAIAASEKAWRLAPRDVPALVLRGEMVRAQYGLLAALPWFDRALEIDRNDVEALLARAATLGELGRTRDMLSDTRMVLSLDPGNARAFYLQAVLAARARNFPLADAMLGRTGGALDGWPSVRLLRGIIAYQQGASQRAIDYLGPLVDAQPANARARRLLAAAQWQAGDAAGVIQTLRPMDGTADADSYVTALLARALEASADRETAALYIDRLGRFGARTDSIAALASASDGVAGEAVRQIRLLLNDGGAARALALAESLARTNAGAPGSHMVLGDVLMRLGRPGEAAAAYRNAANLRFSEPVALRLVEALLRAGRPDMASHVLELFRRQNPLSVGGQVVHADLLMARNDYGAAATLLAGLDRRLGYRDVAIATNLAWSAYRAGRGDLALAAARRAYALAPDNAAVSHAYGWILFRQGGNRAAALALLEQAAGQAPGWTLAQRHLVEARRRS